MENLEEKLDRLNWLLGAIESHTNLFVAMWAKELGIEVVWWDPANGTPPDDGKEHGKSAELKKIYQTLPVRLRGKK